MRTQGHSAFSRSSLLSRLLPAVLNQVARRPDAGDGRAVTRPENITLLMVPLMVLLIGWAVFRTVGALGFGPADSWVGALRFGLALMFVFTAVSHFVPRTRKDFVRMVPPQLPAPALPVTITGLLELAGAVGLLVPWLMRPAAFGLAALLVALFPANVHAARSNMEIAGRPATPIAVRLPLQLFWIGALITVAIAAP